MQKEWKYLTNGRGDASGWDRGQALAEYALIILLFAIALVGAVGGFGGSLLALYDQIITGAF